MPGALKTDNAPEAICARIESENFLNLKKIYIVTYSIIFADPKEKNN